MSAQARKSTFCILLLSSLGLWSATVAAQSPQFLGSYRDWNVYAFTDDNQKICYIASEPKKQEGNYTRRGNPAVLVTRRPGPEVAYEVSVQPGYSYQDGSEVQVSVDGRKFTMFTRGEHAWTKSDNADETLIGAMKRGVDMSVRGTSSKETYSLDTYSLLGFTDAYEAMDKACSKGS